MLKTPPLQCLFCNQFNVASAKYCNECASPLHLQPCNQCGAIDNRTAGHCYKCGAEFNVPAAPELVPAAPELGLVPAATKRGSVSAKRARTPTAAKRVRVPASDKRASAPAPPELAVVPAAPVPDSVPAPPIVEHPTAKPTLNNGGFAIERAFLSKSPAQVVGMIRHGSRREVTETQGQAAGLADLDPTHVNPDPVDFTPESPPMDKAVAPESVENLDRAHSASELQPMDKAVAPDSVQYPVLALSAVEPQPMDDTVESERAMTAIASRRARRLAYLTLLIAATAALGYYYYDRSAQQLVHAQSAGQPTPSMPDSPMSAVANPSTVATPVDATSPPKDTASQPTTGAEGIEKAPSPAAPFIAKPRADPEPVPTNRPLDGPVSRPAAMPQAAGATLSARRSSVIDAGVKSRSDAPTLKECTEPVAALGLCGPIKP